MLLYLLHTYTIQSTNETSKLWFAVHVWLEKDIRKLWEVML